MSQLYDLVGFTTATTGTGTITVGAAIDGHRTLAGASIPDGTVVSYGIADSLGTARETGVGTVGGSGTTLTRTLRASNTGALLNLSGSAVVWITALSTDIVQTDAVNLWIAAQRGAIVALTDGATITPNMASGNFFSATLAGNRTLANPTNVVAGQSGCFFITQDATGSRTLAYGGNWKFAGGTAPTLTTAANAVDRIDYVVLSTSAIHAAITKDIK